jgi:hypothetical protein
MPVALLRRKPSPPNTRHVITPHDNGTYLVESKSAPGEYYVVDVSGVKIVVKQWPTCPCKGYSVRKDCTHVHDAIVKLFQKLLTPERLQNIVNGTE